MEINEFLNSRGVQAQNRLGRAAVDQALAAWVSRAAVALEASGIPALEVREQHLAAALKAAVNADIAGQAVSRVLTLDAWPSPGQSGTDLVVPDPSRGGLPRIVAELKWCQQGQNKVHEAVWDLFKLALLVEEYSTDGYLITAAPTDMWQTAVCGDVFSTGLLAADDLTAARFPNGRPVWDRLLEGGFTNRYRYPKEVPAQIRVAELQRVPVAIGALSWEIRTVRVTPGRGRVSFDNGWPAGGRPLNVKHPPA